jgi:hypothetical protein
MLAMILMELTPLRHFLASTRVLGKITEVPYFCDLDDKNRQFEYRIYMKGVIAVDLMTRKE